MNLEALSAIFHSLFDDEFSLFINAGKFIGVLIFMFTIGKKAFESFSKYGMTFTKDGQGLSPYDLVRGIILLAMIIGITEILTLADKILLLIEQTGVTEYSPELEVRSLYDVELDEPDADGNIWSMILHTLQKINKNIDPMTWIMRGLYYVLFLIDVVLFTVFVAQRFFFMGIIKLFAPIIVGLSILDKYRDLSYDLAKTYIRNFLVIIPYMLVFVFANRVHDAIVSFGYNIGGEGMGTIHMMGMGEISQRTVALLAVVILKFMLLRKSSAFMKQII